MEARTRRFVTQEQRYHEVTQALMRLLSQQTEPIRWKEWLPLFEKWCVAQGWHVEYESVEDESCAIFACQADREIPRAAGHIA